ncbi:MAG: energy transducer TonB [Acidobacteriia bacterium]|nr:energy transducer TonB [Terriglobia bacterium]
MSMLEQNRPPELNAPPLEAAPEPRQRRQMLVALALLLAALILVLYKDWQFWFPTTPVAESEAEQNQPEAAAQGEGQVPSRMPPAVATAKTKPHAPAAAKAVPPVTVAPVVTTNRAVLPPLQVEVVAGDTHRTLQPGSNSVKVDLQPNSPTTAASGDSGVASAAERVRLSPDTTAAVMARPAEPSYPLLAKQMKVQGAVILQALIGKEGNIQDLRVVSGPAILSSAAREAVKQWRFKPYYQAGQAVETEARITVNFTISTY